MLEPAHIAERRHRLATERLDELHTALDGRLLHGLEGAVDGREQIERLDVDGELPGDDARDVEEVLDEARLRVRAALDDLHRAILQRPVVGLAADQLRPTQDRAQRRSQIVRDGGEKGVLRAIRRLRALSFDLCLAVEASVLERDRRALRELGHGRDVVGAKDARVFALDADAQHAEDATRDHERRGDGRPHVELADDRDIRVGAAEALLDPSEVVVEEDRLARVERVAHRGGAAVGRVLAQLANPGRGREIGAGLSHPAQAAVLAANHE